VYMTRSNAVTRAHDEYTRTRLAHIARTRARAARAARATRENRENEYENTRPSVHHAIHHAATASANARWKKLGEVRDHYLFHERVADENIGSLRRRYEAQAREAARKAHEAARIAREADEASWARHRTRQSRFYR